MIILLPIGGVHRQVLESLSKPIENTFNNKVQIGVQSEIITQSWNKKRQQHDADSILNSILNPPPGTKYLGILEEDIFAFGLNFVFGEADSRFKKALISLKRLRQEFYGLTPDEGLFTARAITEAIHELAHTYGLGHCHNLNCVMHFSNSIRDTDKKGWKLCPACQAKLNMEK